MFGSFSYQTKIYLTLAAFLFTILTVVNVINYYRSEMLIKNDLAQNKQQTTIKLQEQVDDLLKEMDKLSISVNASDSIMDVMKNIAPNSDKNYFIENPTVSAEVQNTLLSFTSLQPLKGRISLVSRFGDYLSLSNRMDVIKVDKRQVQSMSTFGQYLNMEEYKVFLPPQPDPWSESGETVVSIVRPLRDNYNVYGYVEIGYSINELDNIFFFRNDLTIGNVIILDANRNILYSSLTPSLDPAFDDRQRAAMPLVGEFGHFELSIEKSGSLMAFYSRLSNTDWNILLVEDSSTFRRPITYMRNSSITVFLAVLAVLMLLLYFYTNRVTRPLRKLKDSLAKVDLTQLELLPARLRTRNEITLLGVAFQELLDELKITMRQAEKSNQRAMVAQMNALQAQVNPHFLHNTLTVIAAYGKSEGNRKVEEMCIALSDMLRYTMKINRKDSTIGAELEHVEQYLTLLQSKYPGFVHIDSSIDPGILSVPIPRLTLQPLVENSFQHGFLGIDPPWRLSIRASMSKEEWTISIADNGIGLSPELLAKTRRLIDELRLDPGAETERLAEDNADVDPSPLKQGNGIGLTNVVARLFLFYGEAVSIRLDNRSDGGMVITIIGRLTE